jgi:hypothetical protein
MNLTKQMTPLQDVLYAFSLAKETPDAELLEDFARKYPEHASELTDLAIDIVMDVGLSEDVAATNAVEPCFSPAVSRAMSRFQNRLFEVKRTEATGPNGMRAQPASVENPFAVLDRTGFRALVKGLQANSLFVARLRDREIDVNTMSDGFKQRVANELSTPLDVVVAHFAAVAQIPPEQFYKADEKPAVKGKCSFEEAVGNSGLTEEQQQYLLGL